jgi:hypothetical protein
VRVEAFVAQATIERFDEGIVGRLTWSREVERDAILVGPAVKWVLSKQMDPLSEGG